MNDSLETITEAAAAEGGIFAANLSQNPGAVALWSPLCGDRFASGLEAIYEGYLIHYGRPRVFAELSRDDALLCGDFLYARGLTWIAELDDVHAVSALAELIATASAVRAEGEPGDDFALWAATAIHLADRFPDAALDQAREDLARERDSSKLEALIAGQDLATARAMHAVNASERLPSTS